MLFTLLLVRRYFFFFFFQAEDGIRDYKVTGVQTCALPISLLIFLPTFFWEYNHHFPVMFHMKELNKTQLQYISPAGFLSDQLLMNLPCAFIWLAGLYFTAFSHKGIKYRTFAWSY